MTTKLTYSELEFYAIKAGYRAAIGTHANRSKKVGNQLYMTCSCGYQNPHPAKSVSNAVDLFYKHVVEVKS